MAYIFYIAYIPLELSCSNDLFGYSLAFPGAKLLVYACILGLSILIYILSVKLF